jgi:hypothetical protein
MAEVPNFVTLHALWAKIADMLIVIGGTCRTQSTSSLSTVSSQTPVIRTVIEGNSVRARADTTYLRFSNGTITGHGLELPTVLIDRLLPCH